MDLNDGTPLKSSNPSNYGYIYSEERDAPAPEVGWSDKPKDDNSYVNLYSENVLMESSTTDCVDRESIANLASTVQQWETIFTLHNSSQTSASTAKKKGTPKWQVRMPYKEKSWTATPSTALLSEKQESKITGMESQVPNDNEEEESRERESVIEQEIRFAYEKECMLKAEKEEQQRPTRKYHRFVHGQNVLTSFEEANDECEAYQPAYNELAEADRRPDFWSDDARGESTEVEIRKDKENADESIIEREIRIQNEREADLSKQRMLDFMVSNQSQNQLKPSVSIQVQEKTNEDTMKVLVKHEPNDELVDDDSVKHYQSGETENIIARELRELKEREEEVERMRSKLRQGSLGILKSDATNEALSVDSNSQPMVHPIVSELSKKPQLSDSHTGNDTEQSLKPRDVKVRPLTEEVCKDWSTLFEEDETPIEREMRMSRERENELRRSKGLPDLKEENVEYHDSSCNTELNKSPQSFRQPSTITMRKFASSRLQQELDQQKEREMALQNEGKITLSSDHTERIQRKRYMEIIGEEQAKNNASNNYEASGKCAFSSTSTPSQEVKADNVKPFIASGGQTPKKGPAAATGGHLFSYKEFKQTAESKIEKELREMREREEELRIQRNAETETPR